MTEVQVEWVDEIPNRGTRVSAFDKVADQVRSSKRVARVEVSEKSFKTLPSQLRERFGDLEVAGRTIGEGKDRKRFVFIAIKEKA